MYQMCGSHTGGGLTEVTLGGDLEPEGKKKLQTLDSLI